LSEDQTFILTADVNAEDAAHQHLYQRFCRHRAAMTLSWWKSRCRKKRTWSRKDCSQRSKFSW